MGRRAGEVDRGGLVSGSRTRQPLHDGAAALLVALDILDLKSDAGSLGKGFVDAAILHG